MFSAKALTMPTQPSKHVVITAYRGVSLLDLAGPMEALRVASTAPEFGPNAGQAYSCTVVSAAGGPIMTSDGVEIVTARASGLGGLAIDSLIVPGALYVEDTLRDGALIAWIKTAAKRARRVCSVCAGTFPLGQAGLLDGRRAVTHWMHCRLLAEKFPRVRVEPDAIYVRDGKVWSSAGVTTGIDLTLALIEEDFGRAVAMHVARVLVVYLKRSGGQSQYSPLLHEQADRAEDRFVALETWIAENLRSPLSVGELAARVHMSPRNFARQYAAQRGKTPAKAVEAIRLDAARRLLEESADPIQAVARQCGFGTEEQLRSTFLRNLGVSPRDYRRNFSSVPTIAAPRQSHSGAKRSVNRGKVPRAPGGFRLPKQAGLVA